MEVGAWPTRVVSGPALGWSESFAAGSLGGCFEHHRPIDGERSVRPQYLRT